VDCSRRHGDVFELAALARSLGCLAGLAAATPEESRRRLAPREGGLSSEKEWSDSVSSEPESKSSEPESELSESGVGVAVLASSAFALPLRFFGRGKEGLD
jgi:hypothetical protein